MDDVDRQQERDEVLAEAQIAYRKPSGPLANGHCHFCEEPVSVGLRWCDVGCRDDWERGRNR